ncbi:unnamed protein product [Prorocentrum cordatum]|uniref:Uncharacterized protein n=1 Tax=Prorocentrum cordatum TaxID=2364126 RepID=A0ABN9WUE1_9DINO|nr:unnamed protein product [Polarella glacialis]
MEAMATRTLQLDEDCAVQSRVQNFVLQAPSENELMKVMDWTAEQYDKAGVEARKKAKDEETDYLGNPYGKKTVAFFSGMLRRLGGTCEKKESRDVILKKVDDRVKKKGLTSMAHSVATALLDQLPLRGREHLCCRPKFVFPGASILK